ncbi:hypothetical protein [Synechococcus sp. J7-Johnson]|uniref:hypothetical protein n=1 Tax=Synechococcus sp. J7-Johnson TaxID=2823737 RepID=UPI0020CC44F7|nr:hypothetical protein [Synechococcus sp. J7-Johnson]
MTYAAPNRFNSRYVQWIASITAISPSALQLFLASLPWPNNWDDFHRGYNGLEAEHPLISYGLLQSQVMLKLAVHDPLLTISNRLDILSPIGSGLLEVILLMLPFILLSRLSHRHADISLASSLLVAPVSLIAIHQKFLPPSAYPLAFTGSFIVATLAAYLTDWRGLANAPTLYRLMLWIGEQLAFFFYACCFLQGFTFWLLTYSYKIREGRSSSLRSAALSGIRFIPLLAVTLLWRTIHPSSEAESLAIGRSPIEFLIASLKWLLNGTTLGSFFNASGLSAKTVALFAADKLPLIASCLFIALLVPAAASLACVDGRVELFAKLKFRERIYVGRRLVLMLGISICIGWTLPVASIRYISEMQGAAPQVYVASRFTGLGVALLFAVLIARLSDDLLGTFRRQPQLPRATKTPVALSLYRSQLWLVPLITWTLTFNQFSLGASTDISHGNLPSLDGFCAGQNIKSETIRAIIPLEVVEGDTGNWLFTLPENGEYTNLDTEGRLAFIADRFSHNLRSHCRKQRQSQ